MKRFIYQFASLLAFPHLICYWFLDCSQRELIDEDLKVMNLRNGGVNSIMYHLKTNKYYRTIFYYRLRQCFPAPIVGILRWILPCQNTFFCNVGSLGGGVRCSHPFSTILNARKIGSHFSFRNNLTVGNKTDGSGDIPTIGNNVFVGANVVIIGNITIGDNVIIGAGAVVTKNVPSNCIVVGNPARVLTK